MNRYCKLSDWRKQFKLKFLVQSFLFSFSRKRYPAIHLSSTKQILIQYCTSQKSRYVIPCPLHTVSFLIYLSLFSLFGLWHELLKSNFLFQTVEVFLYKTIDVCPVHTALSPLWKGGRGGWRHGCGKILIYKCFYILFYSQVGMAIPQ